MPDDEVTWQIDELALAKAELDAAFAAARLDGYTPGTRWMLALARAEKRYQEARQDGAADTVDQGTGSDPPDAADPAEAGERQDGPAG